VRAPMAAKEAGLKLLIGAEIHPTDAAPVVLWATDRKSYGRLSRLLTIGRRRAEKGECRLMLEDIAQHAEGLIAGVIGRGQETGDRGQEESSKFKVQGSKLNDESPAELSTEYSVLSTQYQISSARHNSNDSDNPRLKIFESQPDCQSKIQNPKSKTC